jgi:hypothetical protein
MDGGVWVVVWGEEEQREMGRDASGLIDLDQPGKARWAAVITALDQGWLS